MDDNSQNNLETGEEKFFFQKETREILSCAFEVQNTIGHGLREKTDERCLAREFQIRGISCEQQRELSVYYKDTHADTYISDLIAHGTIIIDSKVIEMIGDREIGQMLNYLKIARFQAGLIINFKHPKVQSYRVVH